MDKRSIFARFEVEEEDDVCKDINELAPGLYISNYITSENQDILQKYNI
jgi:hypothetical protein